MLSLVLPLHMVHNILNHLLLNFLSKKLLERVLFLYKSMDKIYHLSEEYYKKADAPLSDCSPIKEHHIHYLPL